MRSDKLRNDSGISIKALEYFTHNFEISRRLPRRGKPQVGQVFFCVSDGRDTEAGTDAAAPALLPSAPAEGGR